MTEINKHFILLLFFFIHDGSSDWDKMPKECGRTRLDNKKRIIGGEVAELGQFPWAALVGRYDSEHNLRYFCGASLIHRYYLVSATHCGNTASIVRVGEHDVTTYIDCDVFGECAPPYQDIEIERFLFVQGFEEDSLRNDLSLIVLKDPVTFNEFVKPICLLPGPVPHLYFVRNMVSVVGWGVTNSTTRTSSSALMHVDLPINPASACNQLYTTRLLPNQWCIGYRTGKDSCGGDSGGPVSMSLKVNGKRRNYLIGAVSYGQFKCGEGVAVYTDVSFYTKWILNNINKY